jgi:hypothetical protein
MALEHVSQSSLGSFDECAQRWAAERVRKVAVPASPILTEGILAHAVIEEYVNELYQSDLDRAPSSAIDSLVEKVFRENDRALSTECFESVLITARTFAKYFAMVPERVIGVEMELRATFHPDCPPMLSFLDFVTQEQDEKGDFIGITDWKTFYAKTQKPRDKWQLLIYCWQLRNRYPGVRIGVRNHFVRANIFTPWVFPDENELASALMRAKVIYDRQEAAYTAKTWMPNAGDHCEYCPIPDQCELIQGLIVQKHAILTAEDGIARLQEVVVFNAASDKLTASLKTFVNANGPLSLPDGLQASFRTSDGSTTITDIAGAYEVLGAELFGLVNIDGKKIKSYLDDARLDGKWSHKPGRTQFKIGKPKAGSEPDED